MLISQENEIQLFHMCQVINKLKTEYHLTNEKLSRETDIPKKIFDELETGSVPNEFTVDHLFTLCRFFNLHLSEYFIPRQ